jgi:methylmalonyl-CoA mutase cobalamin-binding subunit
MEDTLRQALAVTEVDENDSAVVAGGIHPADERDGLADVGVAEFVAMMSAHGRKF